MQQTSDLYNKIFSDKNHQKEVRVFVNGTPYYQTDIFSLKTVSGLFSDSAPTVGSCVAREIDLELKGTVELPRMAVIRPEVRLISQTLGESEWLKKGTFFIDTREKKKYTTSIHGYDSMLKTEMPYLLEGVQPTFPRKELVVVQDILNDINIGSTTETIITLDADTYNLLSSTKFDVQYTNQMTEREVLSGIATLHVGNWIITDDNKLKLVSFIKKSSGISLLITEQGNPIVFGEGGNGVRIIV